jgi:uncharacterized protein (TIGR03083 family)
LTNEVVSVQETVWHLIRDERLSLSELLAWVPEEQWTTPSLCAEWSVHHVLAHLVMTPAREPHVWAMVNALVRARGHLWEAGRDVAVAYASRSPRELVAALREAADARTKPVFVVSENILLDLVVHGQDIAVPLGLRRPVPDAAAVLSLERIWGMGWPFHARRRLAGVHLQCCGEAATNVVWEAGSGPPLRGTCGDLALLMTGRTRAALPRLAGAGVELISERLDAAGAHR